MNVVSACPLPVRSIAWQSAPNRWTLTVVAKATFVLQPGESPLAAEQDEPHEADGYWNDDERRSLAVASDLAPFKRRADVVLVGHAFAPRGQPVRSLTARMVVGEVDKSIEVHCERLVGLDGALREGQRFTQMPLHWERAAGGPGTTNPVGVRADAAPDVRGFVALPNLQPPGLYVVGRAEFIAPVGFGPIAPSWPTRQSKLHGGLAAWDHRAWQRAPLPADLDASFWNAAPRDQQMAAIRPNERVVLENLHPEHGRLVTNLVAVTPRARVERPGGAVEDIRMRCDTLSIDTDRGTCSLTWRGQIPLEERAPVQRVVVVTAARDEAPKLMRQTTQPIVVPAVQGAPAAPRFGVPDRVAAPAAMSRTQDAPIEGAMPALPFRVGRSPLAGTVLATPAPAAAPDLDDEITTDEEPRRLAGTLPFPTVEARPALPFEPPAPSLDDADTATTLPIAPAPPLPFAGAVDPAAALPFGGAAPPAVIAPPPVEPPPPAIGLPFVPAVSASPPAVIAAPPAVIAPPPAVTSSPPVIIPSPARMTPPPPAITAPSPVPTPWAPLAREEPRPAPPAPPPLVAEPPPPPAMIGPLAKPEMAAPIAESAPPITPPIAAPAPPIASAPADAPAPLPIDRFPLERCAAIAASIACRKPEIDRILAGHELTPEVWEALDRHWNDLVRAQAGRGRVGPLSAYDAAYVGQVEIERGPILIEEYARMVIAQERNETDEVLEDLRIPRGALLRIQRLWLARTTADPELGRAARAAIEAAREE